MHLGLGGLAAGGIVAAGMACIRQIRGFLSYISSCLLIRGQFDYNLSNQIVRYLRSEYRAAPTGSHSYSSLRMPLPGKHIICTVPFRSIPLGIFFKSWRGVLAYRTDGLLRLTTLRGMIKFEDLVCDAIDFCEREQPIEKRNNFSIIKVFGSEKHMGAGEQNTNKPIRDSNNTAAVSNNESSLEHYQDIGSSVSFKYTRDQFSPSKEVEDPFKHLYYPPEILSHVADAERWLTLGPWYAERSIPWRLGWLFTGMPGSGKSSLAKATAKMLGIPIYQYFLNTMSDQEFIERWATMETPCMALLEDLDAVFYKRVSLTEHKSLSYDTVLNQLSGVSAVSGVFLVITTNHIEAIDEAMGVSRGPDGLSTRPGRIDTIIELGPINRDNRSKLAQSTLKDWPEMIPEIVTRGDGTSASQFQALCIQAAFERMSRRPILIADVRDAA